MTLTTLIQQITYTGNDATTVWALAATVLDENDVEVFLFDITTEIVTGPLSNSLYSVAGVPGSISVTYPLVGSPIDTNTKIKIQRIVPYTQALDIINQGGFFPDTVETQLDLIVMQVQQNSVKADMPEFPTAGSGVVINAAGTGFENSASSGSGLSNIVEDLTPQLGGTLDTNSKSVFWSKGTDVTSATELLILTDGNSFDITDTTAITSIEETADAFGIGSIIMLHFDGILTLTHNASDLILPTGTNITTAVGDIGVFQKYASGDWRCVSYSKADGTPLAGGGGLSNVVEDTTPQLGGDLDTNSKSVFWSKGADVASATELLVLTDGNSFDVTGTTPITSIETTANAFGIGSIIMLHFDGILTFTHHTTNLILPGAANITTAVGDTALLQKYATGDWRCINYQIAADAPGSSGGGGAPEIVDFTASGTWTKDSGLVKIRVWSVGGGGGGGGAVSSSGDQGQAGTWGALVYDEIDAGDLGATETVTVGAAGAAGAAGANSGGDGGDTIFGAHHTAPGGPGGLYATHANRNNALTPAVGTGGVVNLESSHTGSNSSAGEGSVANTGSASALIAPLFYLQALSVADESLSISSGNPGDAAVGIGSGGGGADGDSVSNLAGGVGAAGRMIVEEFY